MATIDAPSNKMTAFSGGADVISFTLDHRRPGVALVAVGFDFADATVTAFAVGATEGEEQDTTDLTKSLEISSANNLIPVAKVTVSGLAAGSYQVGAYQ